jgi:hypothetical protein
LIRYIRNNIVNIYLTNLPNLVSFNEVIDDAPPLPLTIDLCDDADSDVVLIFVIGAALTPAIFSCASISAF